ncbi:MAG: succinate dehydrogenase cytochrome b subunit [Bacteroidales bacterium]|jgi:succinate dehydrogenase / fumarate reductase cytochrome b subunit|nr:succinate dehydrogenase cytochrome b subunit [Bacteroidales bacterium]
MSKHGTFSSITKKVIMSLAGLFLIIFLLVHLGINLFLMPLTENHQEIFELLAGFMATNLVIKAFEVVLFGGFIIHIIYGIIVQLQNWASRGNVRYKSGSKTKTTFSSKYMIYTGILVFLFLAMHMYQFYFIKLGFVSTTIVDAHGHPEFFHIAIELFTTQPLFSIIYIVSFVILGFHLDHAFQSAFQTLGWEHPKYTPIIKAFGTIYAIVVPLGFIIIPLYFMIMQ